MDGGEEKVAEKQEDEKPQVSEYSKWMDGAAETEGAAGETESTDTDDAEEAAAEEEKPAEADAAPREQTAVEKETAAQRALDDVKDKIQEKDNGLKNLEESHLGYASLL